MFKGFCCSQAVLPQPRDDSNAPAQAIPADHIQAPPLNPPGKA